MTTVGGRPGGGGAGGGGVRRGGRARGRERGGGGEGAASGAGGERRGKDRRAAGRGGRLGRRAVIPSHMYSNTPIVPPSSKPTPPSAPIPLRLLPPLPPGPAIPQRLLSMTMAVLSDTVILAALGCALAMGVARRTRTQNDSTLASRLCRGQGLARTTLAMLQRVSRGSAQSGRCSMWNSCAYRSMVLVSGFFSFSCSTRTCKVSQRSTPGAAGAARAKPPPSLRGVRS